MKTRLPLTAGLALGATLLLAAPAAAADLKVPRKFRTIQAAVDAARPGDRVVVTRGKYFEDVVVETDGVVLTGRRAILQGTVVVNGDGVTVEKLDPVMVLGFPSGPAILESGKAESSPSRGDVRKVEDTIYVTAPIVPGNSGGPVLDRDGVVIAIATRTAQGEATLGSCIQSRHVYPLLQAEVGEAVD